MRASRSGARAGAGGRRRGRGPRVWVAAGLAALAAVLSAGAARGEPAEPSVRELTDLSLEALSEIEVTSVSRRRKAIARRRRNLCHHAEDILRRASRRCLRRCASPPTCKVARVTGN